MGINTKISVSLFSQISEEIRQDIELVHMTNRSNRVQLDIQSDGGANISVTNNVSLLHHVAEILNHDIGGIGSGITCTHKGIFYLKCDHNEVLPVRMFYSA